MIPVEDRSVNKMAVTQIDVFLDESLYKLIKRVSKRNRLNEHESVRLCFLVGLEVAEEIAKEWSSSIHESGIESLLSHLNAEIEAKNRELMDLNAKLATERFDAYERFNRVSKLLIRYSSKRSEARRLNELLREKGTSFDLSAGEIQNFDDLMRRYLFRESL